MEHFAETVPMEVREKLAELAEYVAENEITSFQNSESYGDTNTDAIYGIHVSGFFPFQDGGYNVNTFIRCDCDASYHIDGSDMEKDAERKQKYDFECFLLDNKLPKDTPYGDLTEEQQDAWFEYEMESNDPALLLFKCWVEREKGNIMLQIAVNSADAPYYRASSEVDVYNLEITQAQLLKFTCEELWKILMVKGKNA